MTGESPPVGSHFTRNLLAGNGGVTTQARATGPAGFTRALLREGRRSPVALPLTRTGTSAPPPRFVWIADAVRKDALLWFFRRGGWQRRRVVAGGRRREGRAWDAGIFEALGMRFTPAALHVLVRAMKEQRPLPPLFSRLQDLEALEAGQQGPDPATGDQLALHRLVELLAGELLDAEPPFPLSYAGEEVCEGLPALELDLRRLQERIRRCQDLTLVARDGLVLASTVAPEARAAWAAQVPELLVASGKRLESGWVDLGLEERGGARRVCYPWAAGKGPPLVLLCSLLPRTRKVNLNDTGVRAALEELPRHTGGERGRADVQELALEGAARARALVRRSPLTLAFRPQLNGGLDGLFAAAPLAARRLEPLFAGDRATLLRYLDDALAGAWMREELLRRRLPAARAHAAYRAAARGLQAYLQGTRERPDALIPVMRFLNAYLLRFGTRVPVVQAFREQAAGFDRASQRDAFLRQVAELFALGRVVQQAAQEALRAAFVDRSEEQKVLLTDYHERYKPIEDEVEAIRRELAGEIG